MDNIGGNELHILGEIEPSYSENKQADNLDLPSISTGGSRIARVGLLGVNDGKYPCSDISGRPEGIEEDLGIVLLTKLGK